MTLAFLGDIHYEGLEKILATFPSPPLQVGMAGYFDKCLFLPPKRPNVVSWHVTWLDTEHDLGLFQKEVATWLDEHHFSTDIGKKGFLPHVTVCRRPFRYDEWREAFSPLPMIIKGIHLYESVGSLVYEPLWSLPLTEPFTWGEEQGGLVLTPQGENPRQLFTHALAGLAFKNTKLVPLLKEVPQGIITDAEALRHLHDLVDTINKNKQTIWKQLQAPSSLTQDPAGLLSCSIRILN